MKNIRVTDIVCLLFILLFLYTGVSKLLEIHAFRIVLRQSPLIAPYAGILAWSLPVTELVIAAAMFFAKNRLAGLLSATILMLLFTVYIAYMLVFSPHLPCSCGGVIKQLSWHWHLVFNTCFVLLGYTGILKTP